MSKKSKPAEDSSAAEPLLFDPAEATPFRDDLFNNSPGKDPDIDLLMVKAIERSSEKIKIAEEDELDIKHGEMILKSYSKELAELEDLEEVRVSNKKIAVIMLILLFFIAFIVIMFLLSKLMDDSPSGTKIKNNIGITRT